MKTTQSNVHYTILVHNIGNVKADLTEELGFGPVSEIMKKYLDDKDYTHHRKKIHGHKIKIKKT